MNAAILPPAVRAADKLRAAIADVVVTAIDARGLPEADRARLRDDLIEAAARLNDLVRWLESAAAR